MDTFNLNAVKSCKDDRDYIYENIVNDDISNIQICDYRNELLDIRNQGYQGTCYAQSASCVKEWQEKKYLISSDSYFSPQFIYNHRDYWNNNIKDGNDINEDYGMQGRDLMKIMKNIGVCDEYLYPYYKIEKSIDIQEDIKQIAKKNVIKHYCKILSLNGLKKSLINNGPCLIAFPVYNYSDQMWIKRKNEKQIGGHAMTVVGFDDIYGYFIIRNSWGKNWGNNNGYTYYYYKDWNSHWECWTTIDDLNNNNSDKEIEPEPEIEPKIEPELEPEPEPELIKPEKFNFIIFLSLIFTTFFNFLKKR